MSEYFSWHYLFSKGRYVLSILKWLYIYILSGNLKCSETENVKITEVQKNYIYNLRLYVCVLDVTYAYFIHFNIFQD